jgi:hypothetical protein
LNRNAGFTFGSVETIFTEPSEFEYIGPMCTW